MPLPNLEDISSLLDRVMSWDEKQALIESTLPGFIEEGYSQNSAMRVYREYGFTFSDSAFRAIYRDIQGVEIRSNRVRSVGLDTPIDDRLLEPYRSKLDTKYRFIINFDYYDDTTGRTISRHLAFDSNFSYTKRELLDLATAYYIEVSPSLEDKLIGGRVSKGFISGNL